MRAHVFLMFLTLCAVTAAHAQSYPVKAIRLISPFPPGGGSDVPARIVGQRLSENVGQPVVIDNRPGAGGNLGAELVARSQADGYTILLGNFSHAVSATLYKDLRYRLKDDFAPVVYIGFTPLILIVHPAVPVQSVRELIVLAKAKPGQMNYASSGSGTAPHLAGELFKRLTGVDLVHVPYKGGAPALTDVMSGQVQIMFSTMPALPQVKAGKVKALAVTGSTRATALPAVPTVAEAGVPGYEATTWYGVLAPAGTPAPAVDRLNAEINRVVRASDIRQRFADQGYETTGGTPGEFAAFIGVEVAKWGKVVREAGVQPE